MIKYAIAICLLSTAAAADSTSLSLAIPGTSQSFQSDKFRTGDLDCSNAIGSSTNLEFGVTGFVNENEVNTVGVFSRITIPLGRVVKDRINCNKLYEMELKIKQLELERLERELRSLQSLAFEN